MPRYPVPADPEIVRIDVDQSRVDLKGSWTQATGAAIEAINLRLGINDYEHVELEAGVVGTRFTNDAHEGRIEFLHAPWGRWSGAFGVQFGEREFAAIGDEAFVPPVDSTNYGVFLIEELQLEDWRFSLGTRVEEQAHRPSGDAREFNDTAASFSAAGIRDFGNSYAFILNFASAERSPVAEELFAFGPHLASGTIEIGDANLRSETANHFDIGFRKTAGERTWTVTGFVTRYDNFIFLRGSGVVDPVENLPVFSFAQQDAELTGIETEFFSPLGNVGSGELDLRLFADRVDATLADGEHLPRIPPLRYGARLEYHDERLLAGFEATQYQTQDDLAPFEERTPGYTMVNADMSWQLPSHGEFAFSVLARATNLLDEDARRHSSLVKAFAPLPGRNLSLAFRALF